ncbi:MAG TPA: hypothetical protein VNT79_12560, partial [Phycisphaerae bacterium]|nr:hypothetical protein [Phycisphaerae bacterium]
MTQAPLDEDVAPRRRGGRSALPLLNMGSRLGAMAWGLLGSLIVLGAAIVFALPRVPAVFSYRGFPSGMTSAADRGVVPEARLETQTYFPDPDDYTRAYRARKIADGALRRWDRMNEINAPEGVQLHWTAPMDYLAAGAGLLAAIWAASADGFEIGVALLPVALGVVYLCLLIWFVRRISGWPAAILCGAVAAVSPAFHRVFALG